MNNQPKPSSTRTIIILIAVAGLAALGYFYYTGGTPVGDSLLQPQNNPDLTGLGSQVLALLNQIQTLKIDNSLFKDPVFGTLRDYSVAIPTQNVGRLNPFAPIPGQVIVPPATPAAGH